MLLIMILWRELNMEISQSVKKKLLFMRPNNIKHIITSDGNGTFLLRFGAENVKKIGQTGLIFANNSSLQ